MTGVEAFAHPEWRAALLAIVAAAAAVVAGARWRSRRRRRALLGPGPSPTRSRVESDALLLVALAAVALALLGPRIGERSLRLPARGVDVVFAIDVSRSMDARDVPPSRLDRARLAVREILDRLGPADRAALVAFAGRGVLLTPLTPDRGALAELLSALDSGLIQPPASDLGAGVRAALEAFEAGGERPAVIFVLSDGEDLGRDREGAAAEATRAGVRVLAASLGTELGAQIPAHGGFLRDGAGNVVVTRRRSERLESLTRATDGALFAADDWGSFDYDRALEVLRRDAGNAPGEMVERRVPAVRVAPFAALAFALLICEGLPRRARRTPRRRATRAVAAATGAVLVLGAAPDGASEGEGRRLLEVGLDRLERGDADAAARAFLAAVVGARDSRTLSLAYYDLGVAHLERGDLPAARQAFFDALAVDPSDAQARFNLEWTLMALDRRPPPANAPAPEPPPEPEPREEENPPRTQPEPRGEPPTPPPLDAAARERWLARVEDDPARALGDAAAGSEAAGRRGEPAW